jgi:hypothetical protein
MYCANSLMERPVGSFSVGHECHVPAGTEAGAEAGRIGAFVAPTPASTGPSTLRGGISTRAEVALIRRRDGTRYNRIPPGCGAAIGVPMNPAVLMRHM